MYRSGKSTALYVFLGFSMSWLLTSTLVDRLLGPLISTHGHTSNRYYYFRYAYSGDSRGIIGCGGGPSP